MANQSTQNLQTWIQIDDEDEEIQEVFRSNPINDVVLDVDAIPAEGHESMYSVPDDDEVMEICPPTPRPLEESSIVREGESSSERKLRLLYVDTMGIH